MTRFPETRRDEGVEVLHGRPIADPYRWLEDPDSAETAAREFVENVAAGPGAWEMMTPEERASLVANADTFAGEQRDPEWADVDLDAFSRITVPVLLTQGDQSPPFFSKIIAQLAEAIEGAEVRTLPGAGHVPHTLPNTWRSSTGSLQADASTCEGHSVLPQPRPWFGFSGRTRTSTR